MIFDEKYILNLAIKISDIETIKKSVNNTRINPLFEKELYENIYKYTIDPKIFTIFDINKPIYNFNIEGNNKNDLFIEHVMNMINNPMDNTEMIVRFLQNFKEKNLNNFKDEKKSIITSIIKYPFSYNKKKKLLNLFFLDFYEKGKYSQLANAPKNLKNSNVFLLNKSKENAYNDTNFTENANIKINLNMKNSSGLTNSKILAEEDPTLLDSLFLEELENLTKNKNSDNGYLFKKRHLYFLPYENINYNRNIWNFFGLFGSNMNVNEIKIKKDFDDFLNEEINSAKINYNDIEYKLFMLNIKLRSMFEIKTFSNKFENGNEGLGFNKLHISTLDKFMFENILLEKI